MDDNQRQRRIRLHELKNALNINNIRFAKAIKTNPGFLSQLLNGHRNITEAFAYQICKGYPKFNPDWLITGEGEMFLEKKEPAPGVLVGVMEPSAVYAAGEGKLERLERKVKELGAELAALRARVGVLEEKLKE